MKHYTTSAPIMNRLCVDKDRDKYAQQFREAHIERVFLSPSMSFADDTARAEALELLGKNVKYFHDMGFEVAIWIGGLGHGGGLFRDAKDREDTKTFTKLKDLLTGEESDDSFCPLCEDFRNVYISYIQAAARLNPDLLMLDDDFRMGFHGNVKIACACDAHIQKFSEFIGHPVMRQEIADKAFSGTTNEYRSIWLKMTGDTLRDFAQDLRAAVDAVNPAVRLGHCACFNTWDADGCDNIELSRIFAGKTRPFLRLIGAPYWYPLFPWINSLGNVIELERLQQSWCEKYAPEIEIFSEGDVFPRPRYVVPFSYLDGFDGALRAAGGFDGILKYMFEYNAEPCYETGYLRRHMKNRECYERLLAEFDFGQAYGVHVFEHMRKAVNFDFSSSHGEPIEMFFAPSQKLLCATSIPITYSDTDDGMPTIVFGENAKYFDFLNNHSPLILDCEAARLLSEAGLDTGYFSRERIASPEQEHFRYGYTIPISGVGRFYEVTAKPGARFEQGFLSEKSLYPSVYYYENADGRRFMVYAFDSAEINTKDAIFRSYGRQRQLIDGIRYLCGKTTVTITENPGAYLLVKRGENKLAIGVWNFSSDYIIDPLIELGETYDNFSGGSEAKLRFIENAGQLTADASAVRLEHDIPPYGFVAFVLSDKPE